jgi:thymidylate synthase ThyX
MDKTNFDPNIGAQFVGRYYGPQFINVPSRLWPSPSEKETDEAIAKCGQFAGGDMENLCEVAGRACYDSIGAGRNSREWYKHIQEVHHLSVMEHARLTFEVPQHYAWHFINRDGCWMGFPEILTDCMRVTINARAVKEWRKWTERIQKFPEYRAGALRIGCALWEEFHKKMPLLFCPASEAFTEIGNSIKPVQDIKLFSGPLSENERAVSLLIHGSRGMSHEWVRHRKGAVSQRSTRFVDESSTPWIEHPLETLFRARQVFETNAASAVRDHARDFYFVVSNSLRLWLTCNGVSKATALKQARGAARGYLGNALYTELVYTASITQWKDILMLRLHPAADGEIRLVALKALEILKGVEPAAFSGEQWQTVPAPDGIGEVLRA